MSRGLACKGLHTFISCGIQWQQDTLRIDINGVARDTVNSHLKGDETAFSLSSRVAFVQTAKGSKDEGGNCLTGFAFYTAQNVAVPVFIHVCRFFFFCLKNARVPKS